MPAIKPFGFRLVVLPVGVLVRTVSLAALGMYRIIEGQPEAHTKQKPRARVFVPSSLVAPAPSPGTLRPVQSLSRTDVPFP